MHEQITNIFSYEIRDRFAAIYSDSEGKPINQEELRNMGIEKFFYIDNYMKFNKITPNSERT